VLRPAVVAALLLLAPVGVVLADEASSGRAEAARKHLEDGEVKREEAKWGEAAKSFARAADLDPSSFVAHVRLQEASVRAGDAASLAARYDKLVADRPDDPAAVLHKLRLTPAAARLKELEKLPGAKANDVDTLRELGRAYLAAGQPAPAKKALETAQGLRPADRELRLLAAEAFYASGDADGAVARLEQALRDDPEAFDVLLALARLHALAGRHAEAVERAAAVLALRPTHVTAMVLRSESLARLGKPAEALESLEAALRVNPGDLEARIAWADLTAKKGGDEATKKATEAYLAVLKVDPLNARAAYGLGWVYERAGNFLEAEKQYRQALASTPSDVYVVNSLGIVLLRQKRFQDAMTQFKKAVDLDPSAPAGYLNLGAALDEQGQWSEALTWYAKCLRIKGQDKNYRALLMSALDHDALGAHGKAEELLLKLRTIRPDDAEVATFLGDNLYFQKKWKAAIKAYQAATKIDAKNRFAWRGLGAAFEKDGKPEDAVDALEKARALKGDDAVVLFALGRLYLYELEDLKKALEAYEGYVKAGGGDTTVPGLIEQIKAELGERK
jgi:tetratricopeptide (TPR) repeat protein